MHQAQVFRKDDQLGDGMLPIEDHRMRLHFHQFLPRIGIHFQRLVPDVEIHVEIYFQ